MLLRTRISLFVILGFVVVCLLLAAIALEREALVRLHYSHVTIEDQSTVWSQISDNIARRMEDKHLLVDESHDFLSAFAAKNQALIQQRGAYITAQLREEGVIEHFQVFYRDGTLAYSSRHLPQYSQWSNSLIAAFRVREAIAANARIRGVGNDKARNIATLTGFPLNFDGEIIGFAVYAADITEAMKEVEKATESSLLIFNHRGRLMVGSENFLVGSIEKLVDLEQQGIMQTITIDGRVYNAVVHNQIAELSNFSGYRVHIRDVSEHAHYQHRITQITLILVTLFFLLVVAAVHRYISRTFNLLAKGVDVLNALSRGDTNVQIEGAERHDEVGQIMSAVEVFRANLTAVDRIQRSRKRQRSRQVSFIRRELTQLAATLDKNERNAVLMELDNLEQQIADEVSASARKNQVANVSQESENLTIVAVAFQTMAARVISQNERLREALAAKTAFVALQSELDLASRVQLSFLPEPMPATETFAIAGMMQPAKEIGGDFYDFFHLDQHRLGIVIADVSGKGVPAALFMAVARTVMRATAPHVHDPSRVLCAVNELLRQNNAEQLFVTVFYGILDQRSGRFTYANGGHNPPLLSDSQGVRPLPLTDGVLLAMVDGLHYEQTHVDLEANARLIFLTDGITEAINTKFEEFGDARLAAAVSRLPQQSPQQDIKAIIDEVEAFTADETQFDDITCVALHFKGIATTPCATTPCLEWSIKSDTAEIVGIAKEIEIYGERHAWHSEWIFNTNLILDELITNIINYGHHQESRESAEHAIHIRVREYSDSLGAALEVVVEDDAAPFDPLQQAPEPDLSGELAQRRVGGLGVYLTKSLADTVTYQRRHQRNRITCILRAVKE